MRMANHGRAADLDIPRQVEECLETPGRAFELGGGSYRGTVHVKYSPQAVSEKLLVVTTKAARLTNAGSLCKPQGVSNPGLLVKC